MDHSFSCRHPEVFSLLLNWRVVIRLWMCVVFFFLRILPQNHQTNSPFGRVRAGQFAIGCTRRISVLDCFAFLTGSMWFSATWFLVKRSYRLWRVRKRIPTADPMPKSRFWTVGNSSPNQKVGSSLQTWELCSASASYCNLNPVFHSRSQETWQEEGACRVKFQQ